MNETSTSYQELDSTSPKKAPYSGWKNCGVGWRAVALTFDGLLLSLIWMFGFIGALQFIEPSTLVSLFEHLEKAKDGEELPKALASFANIATLVTTLISILIVLGYGTLSESSKLAGTPGKYIMGLRVASSEKGQIDLTDAFARNIYKHLCIVVGGALTAVAIALPTSSRPELGLVAVVSIVISIALVIYSIVDPLTALFSKRHQSLHDRWSETLVLKAPGVNRWIRTVIGIIFCCVLSFALFFAFIFLTASWMEQFRQKFEFSGIFEQALEKATPGESSQNSQDSINDEDTSFRISKELTLQRKMLAQDSMDIVKSQQPKAAEVIPTQTPVTRSTKKDYTPYVDGLQVLSKKPVSPAPSFPKSSKGVIVHGLISINGQTFQIKDAVAAMTPNTKVIILSLYDLALDSSIRQKLSSNPRALLVHEQTLVRFQILLNQRGNGCSEEDVVKYSVDFNSLKAKLPLQRRFFSFERSANEIASTEYVQFDCERRNDGYIHALVRGSRGMLLNGSRIPVEWNVDVTVPLKFTESHSATR